MQRVEIFLGDHGGDKLVGPFPGVREGNVVAYEFELPETFEPWPGRTLVERKFALLDLGATFSNPPWIRWRKSDGSTADRSAQGSDCWYVDLVTVTQDGDRCVFRDLYIDVMVPLDGRHYRMLDLDEFADAIEAGTLSVDAAAHAMRRWQHFLDRHLHANLAPAATWTDFPPAVIAPLTALPPFGQPVRID